MLLLVSPSLGQHGPPAPLSCAVLPWDSLPGPILSGARPFYLHLLHRHQPVTSFCNTGTWTNVLCCPGSSPPEPPGSDDRGQILFNRCDPQVPQGGAEV